MKMPGFYAESALLKRSRDYLGRFDTLATATEASVLMTLQRGFGVVFQCCCGDVCTSPMECPDGCQQTCICGPGGTVLADCFCGPSKWGGAFRLSPTLSARGG
jgi:hypothetical protein